MLNVSGLHPLTLSSVLFRSAANNIFHHITHNLDVRKSLSTHSGIFTISYVTWWILTFCSGQVLVHSVMSPRLKIWKMFSCCFVIFNPVNLAKMAFLPGKL